LFSDQEAVHGRARNYDVCHWNHAAKYAAILFLFLSKRLQKIRANKSRLLGRALKKHFHWPTEAKKPRTANQHKVLPGQSIVSVGTVQVVCSMHVVACPHDCGKLLLFIIFSSFSSKSLSATN
jgi:hypothetical protein